MMAGKLKLERRFYLSIIICVCVCVTKLFCTSILKKKKHNHISEKKTYLFSVDFLVTIDIVKGMK